MSDKETRDSLLARLVEIESETDVLLSEVESFLGIDTENNLEGVSDAIGRLDRWEPDPDQSNWG